MAGLETIWTVVMQAAIQAAMAAVLAMRQADTSTASGTNTVSLGEACKHGHGVPALRQPSFNWNAADKYIILLRFEMEVTNILQAKINELTEEAKGPIIKNWLGREGYN